MAEDRFQRFRHLERPRQPGNADAPEHGGATDGRFEALEERKAPGTAPAGVAEGHLDRFRPAAERPLDVAPEVEGELPFIRCAACQMDHNRTAAFCANCGADLRTDEQGAFNARLAAERRAQATVEAAQTAELQQARRDAVVDAAKAQRQMAETLAREVGRSERRRLDAEGFGSAPRGGWGGGWSDGWSGSGWGWGRHRGWGAGFGLVGWLVAMLLRFLFGGRGRW